MKAVEVRTKPRSFWQLVFLQSKVNGAPYSGEQLPGINWNWPKDTYLQRRLRYFRSQSDGWGPLPANVESKSISRDFCGQP